MGNIFGNMNNSDWTDGQQMWRRSDGKKTSWEVDKEKKAMRQAYINSQNKKAIKQFYINSQNNKFIWE